MAYKTTQPRVAVLLKTGSIARPGISGERIACSVGKPALSASSVEEHEPMDPSIPSEFERRFRGVDSLGGRGFSPDEKRHLIRGFNP